MDHLDHMMTIMEDAFDPHWGEAWTRRQLSDSLVLPTIFYRLIGADGASLTSDADCVAPDGFVPAGFTLTRYVRGEEELLLIGVRPNHRGRGLGQLLMKYFERDARSRGAAHLFLEMRINNPAEKLYRSCGYRPVGTRKDYYRLKDGTCLDAVTFSLELG